MDNWKTTVLLLLLGIFAALFFFGFALKNVREGTSPNSITLPFFHSGTPAPTPSTDTTHTPSPTDSFSLRDCPANGWLDCMPAVDETKPLCSKEAIEWVSSHCDPFYGVAR